MPATLRQWKQIWYMFPHMSVSRSPPPFPPPPPSPISPFYPRTETPPSIHKVSPPAPPAPRLCIHAQTTPIGGTHVSVVHVILRACRSEQLLTVCQNPLYIKRCEAQAPGVRLCERRKKCARLCVWYTRADVWIVCACECVCGMLIYVRVRYVWRMLMSVTVVYMWIDGCTCL